MSFSFISTSGNTFSPPYCWHLFWEMQPSACCSALFEVTVNWINLMFDGKLPWEFKQLVRGDIIIFSCHFNFPKTIPWHGGDRYWVMVTVPFPNLSVKSMGATAVLPAILPPIHTSRSSYWLDALKIRGLGWIKRSAEETVFNRFQQSNGFIIMHNVPYLEGLIRGHSILCCEVLLFFFVFKCP